MEIKVIRRYFNKDYTIGKMYIDGQYFCDTLEDKDRGLHDGMTTDEIKARKVYGMTAIPKGTYRVILTQSPKFGRVLPEILDVKCYKGARIHALNRASESLGCIGVGENKRKGMIINSRQWENTLVEIMKEAKVNGESVILKIL